MGKSVCGKVRVFFSSGNSGVPGAVALGALGLDGADIISPIQENSTGVKLYCSWFYKSDFMMAFTSILEVFGGCHLGGELEHGGVAQVDKTSKSRKAQRIFPRAY